jgi:hypothetical protein
MSDNLSYFVFTDFNKWDAINRRPFLGGTTVTEKLLDTYKHPTQEAWLVILTSEASSQVGKYLTASEIQEMNQTTSEEYPTGWPNLDELTVN